ncbi:MAG: mucoidy inhibitor MuiA family protein [Calditrichaceae bacterium]
MKTISYILIFLIVEISFGQDVKKVDSKVIEATVFKDRAMVTREATVNLPKGIHTVLFTNITSDLQDESIRVSGTGPGELKILEVQIERKFTSDIQNDRRKTLNEKIDVSVKVRICSSIKTWTDMLNFVDSNLSQIYTDLRKQSAIKQDIEQQIRTLTLTLNQAGDLKRKDYKNIRVIVECSQKGLVNLRPSYVVENASWYPMYDARVSSESKKIEISYFGMIQQSTGEDWDNIKLTFSTAEPMAMRSLPELDRWYVDLVPLPIKDVRLKREATSDYPIDYNFNYGLPSGKGAISGYITDETTGDPLPGANAVLAGTTLGSSSDMDGKFYITNVPQGRYSLEISYIGYQSVKIHLKVVEKQTANLTVGLNAEVLEGEVIAVMAQAVPSSRKSKEVDKVIERPKYSEVHAKELSTVFELPNKNSVPSDNSPHKVTIAMDDLPVDFEYTSIPKILPKVYLKGKILNSNDYPLLEGDINVFVDNDFINRTYINNTMPTDTIELALGVDESIQIEKVLINKFAESSGLISKTKKITYEYEIQIKNNRKTEEKLDIYDQLPIAMDEDIKIKLLIPDEDINDLNNERKLEWNLNLKPGEKKTIPIKYQVEFPSSRKVYGLE